MSSEKARGHLPAVAKQEIARAMREAMARGENPTALAGALAEQHGVSTRTVWRYANGESLGRRARKQLTPEQLELIARNHGNVRAAHREALVNGFDLSYTAFLRRLSNTDTDLVAAVRQGMQAMTQAGLYIVQDGSYERGDVFGFDHTEIPVECMGKDGRKKLWVSLAIDWGTGYMFQPVYTEGQGLRGDPNTQSVVATVGSVMVGYDDDGLLVGGIPGVWTFDNAAAHLAIAVVNGYAGLGIATHAIRPGSPFENGATENAVGVVEKLVWARLPGYTHHLSTRYGRSPWADRDLLSVEELIAYTDEGVRRLNSRPLERHGGQSPRTVWAQAPGVIEFAGVEQVRHQFTRSPRQNKVTKNGVMHNSVWFTAPELAGHVGRTVQVRHLPGCMEYIDVYLDGELLATLKPQANLTKAERAAIARQRRSRVGRAERIQKRSAARAIEEADRQSIADVWNGNADVDGDGWEVDEELLLLEDLAAARHADALRHVADDEGAER